MSDKKEQANPTQHSGDVTGRDRLAWNAIVSWASQLFVIISGFVVPRLMHESLGQTILGIWDFSWAFASYLGIISLGISSSVNRFVAKYRAESRWETLNAFVSTVAVIQFLIACTAIALLWPIREIIELYYAEELGEDLETAKSVVTILGLCFATEILFDSSRGVISGHHRWDIHNSLYAVSAFLNVVLMTSVLLLGGNLVHLAIAYLVSVISVEVFRLYMAIRVAPYIKRRIGLYSTSHARELLTFGIKTLLTSFPRYILTLTVNLITVAFLGPAALAVYARPFALIRHLNTFMGKFTMILTPTASSIQSLDDREEIQDFFLSSLKFNFSLAVPAIAFFVCFGDVLVGIWMGPEYQNWLLMTILALGHLLALGQDGALRIIQGLNRHGRLAIYQLVALVITSLIAFIVSYSFEWTLIASALTLVIPITIAYGIVVPVYSCRVLEVGLWKYTASALAIPMLYNLPFIVGLTISRILYEDQQFAASALAFVCAGLFEAVIYFVFLLPDSIKSKIYSLVRRIRPA